MHYLLVLRGLMACEGPNTEQHYNILYPTGIRALKTLNQRNIQHKFSLSLVKNV